MCQRMNSLRGVRFTTYTIQYLLARRATYMHVILVCTYEQCNAKQTPADSQQTHVKFKRAQLHKK